jgi:thymidylate synthase
MLVIKARNVHNALPEAIYQLRTQGVPRESRNGSVYVFPTPVTTVYEHPDERVVFWPERDANPFFHFFESLWMLGGRKDVEYLAQFVGRMRNYSDDGETFYGAYGWRWRHQFGADQLTLIIEALKANPDDRRQVLSMWSPSRDLGRFGKDTPCNLQVIFQIAHDGKLDMIVTNRSNDLVWGAYGANAVHFSYLHEYMARSIGVHQGRYYQVSANLHAYLDTFKQVADLSNHVMDVMTGMRYPSPYEIADERAVKPYPLMMLPQDQWDAELDMFLKHPDAVGFNEPFFKRVAVPMWRAHQYMRDKSNKDRFDSAIGCLMECRATDWRKAATEWVTRRKAAAAERYQRAMDDGVRYE